MTETLLKTKHTTVIKEDNGHEMIQRPVAVGIIAYDRNTKEIIMVKQERGKFGKIHEIPAGKVDSGEKPIDAVRRELLEETGYKAGRVMHLMDYYPSVGYTTEEIGLYYTHELEDTKTQRLDDNERIDIVKLNYVEVQNMIRLGVIKDSKTIISMFAVEEQVGFE